MTDLEVLVVDDDPGIRTFLSVILQDNGFSVRSAQNGKDALELIRHKKPHLILLDIMMPIMTGEQLCSILKKDTEYNDITIFVISARTDMESQEYLRNLGADEYLLKPIDGKALVNRLDAFRAFMEDIRKTPSPLAQPVQLPPLDFKAADSGSLRIPVQNRYGGFRVESLVGSGGMGHVFKGFDERLERHVAVKVLSPKISDQPESVERFRREAVTLAALNHPGIAMIFLFGEEKGQYYFAMQWCGGGSLLDMIRRVKRIAPLTAIDIVIQTARALEAAANRGVIHRDIKPSNIMFDDNQTVKIVDFGLAFQVGTSEHLTKAGEFLGSPSYASPEQATSDNVDHRSDIYSLGITLYQMLSGRVPFKGKTQVETVLMHIKEPFPAYDPELAIPQSLYEVIARMTEKDPSRRYQKYSEFIGELEKLRTDIATDTTFKIPIAVQATTLQNMGKDIFECLSTLLRNSDSGALQVRIDKNMWIFLVDQSEIVYFESDHPDDSVGMAFYRRGWLTKEDLPGDPEATQELFARVLQNSRFNIRQLNDFLSQHVRKVVKNLLDLSGNLSFRQAQIQHPFLHLKIGEVLLDYVRTATDEGRFTKTFPSGGTLVREEGYDRVLRDFVWKPEESFILSRIEGPDITVDMLQVLTGLPEAVVARTVYSLVNLGAVRWVEAETGAPVSAAKKAVAEPASQGSKSLKDSGRMQRAAGSTGEEEEAPMDIDQFRVRIELKKSERMVEDEYHIRVANQFYELAQEKFAAGDYWKVTDLCRQAISNHPTEAKYHVLMAQAFARHPKFVKDAEDSFFKALELAPWNPDYHFELASFYHQQGLSIRSWAQIKKTLEILPGHERGKALLQKLKKEKSKGS